MTRNALLTGLLTVLFATPAWAQVPEAPPPPEAPRPASGELVITGDYTLAAGERVEEIVVVGGDLRVLGTVESDAVVVGGNLILEESGKVLGDALVTDGEILLQGGTVSGEMRSVEAITSDAVRRATSGARVDVDIDEPRIEREIERSMRGERSWFEPIKEGFAGLISTLALGLVLAGLGAALVFYGRPYLETVSDTVRGAGWRSGAAGLAANFLALPLFVALVVILAVTIVGIPLLLVAVPLYPLVFAAAGAFGLLAVAHAIGERTAEQGGLGSLRYRNSYAYLLAGLGMLFAPLVVANLIGMTGFLGFIAGLLKVVAWVAIWLAATAGLGAVILSRAGTRRTFVPPTLDPAYEPDPLFDDDPSTRESHV